MPGGAAKSRGLASYLPNRAAPAILLAIGYCHGYAALRLLLECLSHRQISVISLPVSPIVLLLLPDLLR